MGACSSWLTTGAGGCYEDYEEEWEEGADEPGFEYAVEATGDAADIAYSHQWGQPSAPRGTAGILRYKEKEEMSVPAFPTGNQVGQWRMQVAKNLAASSGRYDMREIDWFVKDGFGPTVTFESLADSGEERFRSLDLKLSVALSKMLRSVNNALSTDVAQMEQKMAEDNGRMLTGRQIAFKIYLFYQSNPSRDFTYGVKDLTNLPYNGDNNIPAFLQCWRMVISKMKTQLKDEELQELLYDKIKTSKLLRGDIEHYDRQMLGHPERSYQFLMTQLERRVNDAQMARNRANDEAALRNGNLIGHKNNNAAPAPKGKAKAKAKAKAAAEKDIASQITTGIEAALAAKGVGGKKGKGAGAGKGESGKKGKGSGDERPVCWFFNSPEGCTRTKELCTRKHVKISAAQFALLPDPRRGGAAGGGAGKGKGNRSPSRDGKGGGKTKTNAPQDEWCRAYISSAGCTKADCQYPHVEKVTVDEIKEKRRLRAAAKAKAKPKAAP